MTKAKNKCFVFKGLFIYLFFYPTEYIDSCGVTECHSALVANQIADMFKHQMVVRTETAYRLIINWKEVI